MTRTQSSKNTGIIQFPRGSSTASRQGCIRITPRLSIPLHEVSFEFARSGGPGGQNVNKVETRVDLLFNVRASRVLDESQKQLILGALASRIDTRGILRVSAQRSRSQWRNREEVLTRFSRILTGALAVKKERVPTRPGRASRERRITSKRRRAQVKQLRGHVSLE